MDYLILSVIGMLMGLFGGLLGIGGSVVMIPALVFAFGENQHLYQAAAMICNFFVGASATFIHKKAKVLVIDVVKWLVPAGIIGILAGVWLSNIKIFAGDNSRNLAHLFGLFLIYVIIQQLLKLRKPSSSSDDFDLSRTKKSPPLTSLAGLLTGLYSGLLGMGGGVVCTPTQQLFLKMPLKRAISNSSALIASMALIGAVYKNLTLPRHGVEITDSLKMAVVVIPTAIIGSVIGSRLMHVLPKNTVRIIFTILLVIAVTRMLTV